MSSASSPLCFSGDSFTATYRLLTDTEDEAASIAREICVEQTVEFPIDLISRADILQGIVGKTQSITRVDTHRFDAKIQYAAEVAGTDFVQFLNVLFGNSGLKPGLRLIHFSLPEILKQTLKGPRYGAAGLFRQLRVSNRPLLATALKPMGLSNKTLADFASAYAQGGIDIIKDDHGLANQDFTPFEDRVRRCADAVKEANARFSRKCLYMPNITGPIEHVMERAHFAKDAGAGGLMIAPGLMGFDMLRQLCADETLKLPILSHPAFLGPLVLAENCGISHGALFGRLNRVAGADIAVFPSFGGRFAFSQNECKDIVTGLTGEMDDFSAALPAPAGGMTVDRVIELLKFYGNDAVFLIGGDLHRQGPNLAAACCEFRNRVENR